MGRVVDRAQKIRSDESTGVSHRVDQRDGSRGPRPSQRRRRKRPERSEHRRVAGDGNRQREHDPRGAGAERAQDDAGGARQRRQQHMPTAFVRTIRMAADDHHRDGAGGPRARALDADDEIVRARCRLEHLRQPELDAVGGQRNGEVDSREQPDAGIAKELTYSVRAAVIFAFERGDQSRAFRRAGRQG